VDETSDGWDTAPAFVLGTVWGAASMQTSKVWIGAVPVFNEDKILAQFFLLALQLHHDWLALTRAVAIAARSHL
jgi:hypothetical protein